MSANSDHLQERISDVDVSSEMKNSFLEYAYSVIYSRALPDARDGLKPVQRRILYQMDQMGLHPDRGHVKSARVTGEVMGKLHPHGDSAIYDALVRMSQDFTLRLPLIDGHGNFGSLDDGPAAARYTEVRLRQSAMAMVESIDEDVVDFVPNYDNQLQQPDVLPAAFPNLLVNGSSGIAVGMATNMAPHNLVEVIGAARHLLMNPDATLDDLMEFVPGPDLPGGGTIVGLDGIKEAYETGRGTFKTRATVAIEQITSRKTGLVVTELPYMVGPEKVIEKIKDGVSSKKIEGIQDVSDLTDRKNGMRLVITLRSGFNAKAVLEQLYRLTPLEDSFGINNVALVEGSPQVLGLKDLLQVFVDHRIEVTRRRSEYRLLKRQNRLHLVDGLLIAIADIDEVIQVIRSSEDSESAKARLIEIFDLSDVQAEYILELRLRRLTKFSRIELENESTKLKSEIAELEALLSSATNIRQKVSVELAEVAEKFGTPRRTILKSSSDAEAISAKRGGAKLTVTDGPCAIILSASGRIARVDLADGENISKPTQRSDHDAILSIATATILGEAGVVCSDGTVRRFKPVDLPALPSTSAQLGAGVKIDDFLSLARGIKALAVVTPEDKEELALGTAQGIVKRVQTSAWPTAQDFSVISLKDGDKVVGAANSNDQSELVFISQNTQLLHFSASLVRPQGRPASGMAGINLTDGDSVIFFRAIQSEDAQVVTISSSTESLGGTDPGRVKVSLLTDFPAKGRATGGVRAHSLLKGESSLAQAFAGATPLAIGFDGKPRELPTEFSKRDASGSVADAVIGYLGSSIDSFAL
ncbi:MAG: DNA topoisomerase IV subunit A [Microbacteriaceae bacterium]|nr:DNA topoisomerase IV subunit A [Microbacteriaceae bacterium]